MIRHYVSVLVWHGCGPMVCAGGGRVLLANERETEAFLVEYVDKFLAHFEQRENHRSLLRHAPFELVVLKHMAKLISNERLSHQPRHALLNLVQ